MVNVIRLGLFGASNILEKAMCDAFINHPNIVVVGLASKSLIRLESLSNKLKCQKYNSYDLLINSNKIDAAYISLANSMHYEISKKLLNKGIHCLVEKPLACSSCEAKELNEIAKKNCLALVETFQFQHHSQFNYIKDQINNKRLGELRCVDIKFGFPLLPEKNNIRYKKHLNGGAFFDVGVYISKIASLLINTDKVDILSNINYLKGYEVDMYGSCLIINGNNSVKGSWGFDNNYSCSLDIWFSKARLIADRIFTAKKEYAAKVEITSGGNKMTSEFIDDQYYNTIEEFYLTIFSELKMNENYISNLTQSKLMSKIYEH